MDVPLFEMIQVQSRLLLSEVHFVRRFFSRITAIKPLFAPTTQDTLSEESILNPASLHLPPSIPCLLNWQLAPLVPTAGASPSPGTWNPPLQITRLDPAFTAQKVAWRLPSSDPTWRSPSRLTLLIFCIEKNSFNLSIIKCMQIKNIRR